jgi:predicted ribosome quality control (RQC) complex YloA/Tae2 family protein
MSFDGNVVHTLVGELKETIELGRVNKIYQLTDTDLLFFIHTKKQKEKLYISCSPNYTRLHLTKFNYDKPPHPKSFGMFLRKHLDGGVIQNIHQVENDRVIIFDIQKRNELGDRETKHFIVEAMGRHGNMIVTKEDYTILDALKHSMPFDGNQRTIFSGATYAPPKTNQDNPYKSDIDFIDSIDGLTHRAIMNQFMGFSPLGAKELCHRYEQSNQSFKDVFNTFLNTSNPVIVQTAQKAQFYKTTLSHLEGDVTPFDSLNDCLDTYYHGRDRIDKLKQSAKYIIDLIKREQKRIANKIEKLSHQLHAAKDREIYRIKGELIQTYMNNINKGDTTLCVTNYYTNEPIDIDIDNRLSPIENAQKYFKKYKKMKKSIPYIKNQITLAQNEQVYFDELNEQINHASLKDIEEIKEELIEKRYMRKKRTQSNRKRKPQYDRYIDDDGVTLLVGKNNLQNAYITHKVAKYNEVWFHVQNAPGSHVVVQHPFPLSETTIRTAAQLASYYSKMQKSSSVPVDYTEIRHIKKVPGQMNSFVTYTHQKTIYIDPDETFVLNLKRK